MEIRCHPVSLKGIRVVCNHIQMPVRRRVFEPLGCELAFFLSAGQDPPAAPSSPGPLEPEKGERRVWAMPPVAVALKPVSQQSRGEVRDDLPGAPAVLCGTSPDLSLLLGPPFQNQNSFQPLEPKPDVPPPSGNRGRKPLVFSLRA